MGHDLVVGTSREQVHDKLWIEEYSYRGQDFRHGQQWSKRGQAQKSWLCWKRPSCSMTIEMDDPPVVWPLWYLHASKFIANTTACQTRENGNCHWYGLEISPDRITTRLDEPSAKLPHSEKHHLSPVLSSYQDRWLSILRIVSFVRLLQETSRLVESHFIHSLLLTISEWSIQDNFPTDLHSLTRWDHCYACFIVRRAEELTT